MEIKESNRYWKLIDVIDIENGITKLPRNYKINGNFEFLDYKNVYNKETVSDFKLNNLPKINIFEKDIKKFYNDKKDCIVVTWSSETNYDIFQACYIETDKPFVLNGFSKIMKIKDIYKDKILPKWLAWYLNFDLKIQKQRESIPYTTRCNMNKNELKNIRINFCDIKEQQEIINIIEPKEDLFLKYHSIIDISNLDVFKESWYNLINIIEPFEKFIDIQNIKIKNIIKIIENQLNNMKKFNFKLSNYKNFQGFAFKSNIYNKNGKFKIFKIANIRNNSNNFTTTDLLVEKVILKKGDVVTGLSGTIGTAGIILENKNCLLNQRLLSIRSEYSLLIKFIIEKNKDVLESLSTGSVQMNITKSNVLELAYDEKLNNNINKIISNLYINYNSQIKKTKEIIDKLIQMYI